MLQSIIRKNMGYGVPGELRFDGPVRSQPRTIASTATGANCVFGRMFTVDPSSGDARPGGTGVLLGILCNPKAYAANGTAAGGTLAPTLTLKPSEIGEFLTMGEVVVVSKTAAVEGAYLAYDTTTGEISAYTGATPPAGTAQIPNAMVQRCAQSGTNGLINAQLTGTFAPTAA